MARVVVCGYMVRLPFAGNVLAYLQYVLGLQRLGHQVSYLEESGWPKSCYDFATQRWGSSPDAGLRAVHAAAAAWKADIDVYWVDRDTGETRGASRAGIERLLADADLLVNVGGACSLPEFEQCDRRVLIDMDPLFTQVGALGIAASADHHLHFSYGLNIGQPDCTVPDTVGWLPLTPPVVADLWDPGDTPPAAMFTTVTNWSAYKSVEYDGEHYGQKDREFERLISLPSRTDQPLQLCVSGLPGEAGQRFRAAGWQMRFAQEISGDIPSYRDYILSSRGEFSAAKHAYVATRSGWFSDRSVCYLAAGRPVVLQDTGFSRHLPTGAGLLAFDDVAEAADALDRINADYPRHAAAARELVREHLGHDRVLPRLVDLALGAHVDVLDRGPS